MHKYNKLTLLLVLCVTILSTLSVSAQQRTYSPLSRYGYGEMQNISYSGYGAMGHTGIAFQSAYGINNLNPAANASMDSLSFYFDAGMSYFWQGINSGNEKAYYSNTVFDYVALGFSITPKASATAGFKPFSSGGYKYQTITEYDNTTSVSNLTGDGNLTELYLGLSYKIGSNLSIGANVNYIFGTLENMSQATFSDATAQKYGSHRKMTVGSVNFDFGAQYKINIADDKSLIIGATYQPKQGLSGERTVYQASGDTFGDDFNLFSPSGRIDTITYNTGSYDGDDFQIPAKLGLGLSYNIEEKLKLGFDYEFEQWEDINFSDDYLRNTQRYSVGAEFIPKDRAVNNYLSRIRYRAGGFYKNEYVSLSGEDLNNYGITFGLGLPLRRSKTMINLSFEYGQRNLSGASDYTEDYGRITVNFSLHEFWFAKRKLD